MPPALLTFSASHGIITFFSSFSTNLFVVTQYTRLYRNKVKQLLLLLPVPLNKSKTYTIRLLHFLRNIGHSYFDSPLGIMGGEWYHHPGGGTNYLCLPHNPRYDKYKNGHQVAGYIDGTEYRIVGDPFKKRLNGFEAPCVVCFVKSRGSMLMMPARNDCPSGWTEEYHGYLMTEYFNHKHPRDFICVDGDPEYVSGTHRFENYSALLYPVEGRCGSLPCLPYVAGRELTCAVCTK